MKKNQNQRDRSRAPEGQSQVYACPCCEKRFDLDHVGALYGLHPEDFDDIFITVLCSDCTDIVTADPSNPERLSLKNELVRYLSAPLEHRFHQAIALTSLKVLEVHRGNLGMALGIGWPFPKAMHHYHVSTMLDGEIVIICEKEAGDA